MLLSLSSSSFDLERLDRSGLFDVGAFVLGLKPGGLSHLCSLHIEAGQGRDHDSGDSRVGRNASSLGNLLTNQINWKLSVAFFHVQQPKGNRMKHGILGTVPVLHQWGRRKVRQADGDRL